jgi:hypothetical protein
MQMTLPVCAKFSRIATNIMLVGRSDLLLVQLKKKRCRRNAFTMFDAAYLMLQTQSDRTCSIKKR